MTANRPISTSEAERLLDAEPAQAGLEELGSLVASLRASRPPPVEPALIERVAVAAAAVARSSLVRSSPVRPVQFAATAAMQRRSLRLRHRLATGAAAITLVLGSGAGVAVAADGAAPGDVLYGLDRALENVAVGNGGAAERLREAAALVEAGHLADGLEHAAEVLAANHGGESGGAGQAATEALRAAAARIAATADPTSEASTAQVEAAVGDVLTYLSEHVGDVDDGRVAELSQLIASWDEIGQ